MFLKKMVGLILIIGGLRVVAAVPIVGIGIMLAGLYLLFGDSGNQK